MSVISNLVPPQKECRNSSTSPSTPPKYIYFPEYAKLDLKFAACVYENENQMSIDNGIAEADTLLNENSCRVAEEAENLMSLIWMSFTFLPGNSVELSRVTET